MKAGGLLKASIADKSLAAAVMTGLLLVGMLYLAVSLILFPSFRQIEDDLVHTNAQRAVRALYYELDNLNRKNRDWAVWKATWRYLHGQWPSYPEDNYDAESLYEFEVDALMIFDESGALFDSYGIDRKTVTPANVDALKLSVARLHGLMREEGETHVLGMMLTDDGRPVLVAGQPIDDPDDALPPQGRLYFLRFIDEAMIDKIQSITEQPLRIDVLDDAYLQSEGVEEIKRHMGALDFNPWTRIAGNNAIEGHFLMPDLFYAPILHGVIVNERQVYYEARKTILLLLIVLLGIALIGSYFTTKIYRRLVLDRLLRLKRNVETLGDNEGFQRLAVEGSDEIAALTASFNDLLTRLQMSAEKLEKSRREAETASTAKGRFLANMSHEIRTPMTAIIGYAELLEDDSLGESERKAYLRTITENGHVLLGLINDILDLSRIEEGRLKLDIQSVNLVALIDDIVNLFANRAVGKGISLVVDYRSAVPETVACDPLRLRQILVNLVGNAIKFTAQGEVRIEISFASQKRIDRHYVSGTLAIDIRDSGIGISEEHLKRLFMPFEQGDVSTTRRFGGTGLGLSIARQLVDAMRGTISVASEQGQGSVFSVRFPLTVSSRTISYVALQEKAGLSTNTPQPNPQPQPPAPMAKITLQTSDEHPSSGGNESELLVAEDNPVNLLLLEKMLTKAGYRVRSVENGADAFEQAQKNAYALIVLDMQMPRMDGYSVARELRAMGNNTPIIALTANAMAGDREKCLAAGCDDFASKPVRREEFLAQIDALLKRVATESPPSPAG